MQGAGGADLGLTSPWPRCPPGGDCSGCCTHPWSVCEQSVLPEQVPAGPGSGASTEATREREVRGTCWGQARDLDYLLLVNTGAPGVLVSQPFRRPSSPPVREQECPLTMALSAGSGHF